MTDLSKRLRDERTLFDGYEKQRALRKEAADALGAKDKKIQEGLDFIRMLEKKQREVLDVMIANIEAVVTVMNRKYPHD